MQSTLSDQCAPVLGSILMAKNILIIQGHPDSGGNHLCHSLENAYTSGAVSAGHTVHRVAVAELEFPLLRKKSEFEHGPVPLALEPVQQAIMAADHLLIIFPLWLGEMPALLKGLFEHIFRPGFAFRYSDHGFPQKQLKGKSARIVITMGMPALIYRWYFGAHGLKNLKRNILAFCGIGPIRENLFGMVEGASDQTRRGWIKLMRSLGERAA
jgi:putative NADPH-quinone reductase